MSLIHNISCIRIFSKTFLFKSCNVLVPKANIFISPRSSLLVSRCRNNHIQIRTFIMKKKTELDFKISDNVPDEFQLIYRNRMTKYITLTQFVTTLTAAVVCLGFCLNPDYSTYSMHYELWSKATETVENEKLVYISTFIFLVVMMQIMIAKIPLRIYKIPKTKKYILISPGGAPFTTKRSSCLRGEIHHLEESGFLPWKNNRYLIKTEKDRKNVILLDHYFRRPADLYIMLGEQRDPEVEDKK